MQEWVKEKLKEKGLSQAELARRIGMDNSYLTKKFQGKHPFLYGEVVAICRELGIDNPLDYDWGGK